MSLTKVKMHPLRLGPACKTDVRTQFGALCYRVRGGAVQILMVTSRGTGRWILPKGWPRDGATPVETAADEAWEEAGARGKMQSRCLGIYSYAKWIPGEPSLPCVVAMFPLQVKELQDDYPEAGERKRKWMSPKKAAQLVDEPELQQIIRNFDPNELQA